MSLGDILHTLTELHKKTIRRKEKLTKKNIKAKYAIVFNQTCLQEHILPAYTNIYIIYIYIYIPIFREQVFSYTCAIEFDSIVSVSNLLIELF